MNGLVAQPVPQSAVPALGQSARLQKPGLSLTDQPVVDPGKKVMNNLYKSRV